MTTVSSTTSTSSTTTSSSTTATSSSDYLSFDPESLVEAKLATRYARIDSLQTQVDTNTTKITAYQDLQDKLLSLQETLQSLRSDPSTSGQDDDVFLDRSAYLTLTGSGDASSYLSATIESGTDLGSHTISITQIATANKIKSDGVSSRYDALGYSGTFSIGTDGGDSAEFTVTTGMSLGDIVDTINAQKSTTGVQASILKQSDSSFIMVLTTTSTGENITLTDVDGTLLSDTLGFGTADTDGTITVDSDQELQVGQDAILTVDGVTVQRSSNDIDDILDGVTLHLYAATSTTMTLSVENDLDSIKEAVASLVELYNSFRDIVITNQTVDDDGTASDSATLFADNTLRSISSMLQTVLSSSIDDENMAALGVTFDENNYLVLDEDTLDNALLNNLEGIQKLFSYSSEMSSGDLALVRHPDSSFDFTLDVTVDSSGTLVSASVNGDSSLFTVSGSTIKGATGSIYEGLTFAYTGKTSKSIDIELSQGLADLMYYDVEYVADDTDGTLTDLISNLEDQNDNLNDRIDALTESTQTYADYLYSAYSTVAAKLAVAQTTIALLEALLNANSS